MSIALISPQEFIATITGSGVASVTAAGTRVQLTTTQTHCTGVVISAFETNPGVIVVGGSDVVAAADTTRRGWCQLEPGEKVSIPIRELSNLYIDATVATSRVLFCPILG